MKNLFRIYRHEPPEVLYVMLAIMALIRIFAFMMNAFSDIGSSASFADPLWNVYCPILITMFMLQALFGIYKRKELMLLPESCQRKYVSLILFMGLLNLMSYAVLIIVDLLLNAIFAVIQPEMLYSPLISLQSLASYVITTPTDFLFLLLIIAICNVFLPLLINNNFLMIICNTCIGFWFFMRLIPRATNGELSEGCFSDQPWMIVLCIIGIALCYVLGLYCFKRRAVCDHKLLNL